MIEFEGIEIGEKYSRPFLSKKWGYKSHKAIERGVITPRKTNIIVLFVTRIKQETLPQYNDFISADSLFWEGEGKHGSDVRIVNAKSNGDVIHLFYREIHHTDFEYCGIVELISHNILILEPSRFVFRIFHDQGAMDDIHMHNAEIINLPQTEKDAIIRARIGQGPFRQQLLKLWDNRCAVTGIKFPQILRASHIKPWRRCNNSERLNVYNGLLLSPTIDQLFDLGFISFENHGAILVSKSLKAVDYYKLLISGNEKLRFVENSHKEFLEHHRERTFIYQTKSD